jgi:hypothetical protein
MSLADLARVVKKQIIMKAMQLLFLKTGAILSLEK